MNYKALALNVLVVAGLCGVSFVGIMEAVNLILWIQGRAQ